MSHEPDEEEEKERARAQERERKAEMEVFDPMWTWRPTWGVFTFSLFHVSPNDEWLPWRT